MKLSIKSIEELVDVLNSGDYVLPEIQRDFVWEMNKIAELWDSIYRGYPIGQLLFWNDHPELSIPTYAFFNDVNPPLFVAKKPLWHHTKVVPSENKIIVLDGQQRLTSLALGMSSTGIRVMKRKNSPEETVMFLCIYIGDDEFVHASRPGVGVTISRLDSTYYMRVWYGAKRLV